MEDRFTDHDGAMQYALRILQRRDHTQHEMITKLKRREYDDITIQAIMSRLYELGYVNDERFAQRYVEHGIDKGMAGRSLKQKLYNKGINRETLDRAISEIDKEQEYENAITYARRIATKNDLKDPKLKQKIYRRLQYRGFDYDMIANALKVVETDD